MHMGAYPAALGKWVLLGGIIGVAGGVIGSLFHIGVNYATAIRGAHPWILYLLPVGGLAIVGLYKLCHLEGKGTNAIIESVHFGESVPILLVPVIFVSTVITHLCGGSAGREGAALQIGGGLGYEAGKLLHLGEKDLPLATLCGMSGVFSALFGTPLTATVFALEVISVGVLYYAGLVPCITAAMAAFGVSTLMGVEPTRFGGSQVTALRQVDFSVEEGEYVAIMGESGSGKTTLLNILAALDKPTAGRVELDGRDMSAVRESDAAAFRRDNLGFVFQEFNLLDTFTLRDNIYLPLVLAGRPYRELKARLDPIARQLGILELLDKYPYEVSGGQKQRAAVARALITHPRLILADEPTGALDSRSTDELLDLFAQINRQGQTILMVTHSVKAASHAGRVLFIKDGQVFHQLYRGQCTDEQLYQKIADTLTMLQAGGDRT